MSENHTSEERKLHTYLETMRKTLSSRQYREFISEVHDLAEIHARAYQHGNQITSTAEPRPQKGFGEAYWTFKSDCSRIDIEEGLQIVREVSKVPQLLEITVLDNQPITRKIKKERWLSDVHEGKQFYLLGKMPQKTNREVALLFQTLARMLSGWKESDYPFELIDKSWESAYMVGKRLVHL